MQLAQKYLKWTNKKTQKIESMFFFYFRLIAYALKKSDESNFNLAGIDFVS